jgi:hypothetical protein
MRSFLAAPSITPVIDFSLYFCFHPRCVAIDCSYQIWALSLSSIYFCAPLPIVFHPHLFILKKKKTL